MEENFYVIEKIKDIIDNAKYFSRVSLGYVGFTMSIKSCTKFNSEESAILEIYNIFNHRSHLKGKIKVTKITT